MKFELYERVEKTHEFPSGSKPIEEGRNPFSERPCLLCVAAVDNFDKSVFGLSKAGMEMARLRVRGKTNGKIDVKDCPVSFLSLKKNWSKDPEKQSNRAFIDFAETYFTHLISIDGKRLDCQTAMKNMRNVNIMCYCNGTSTAIDIENFLVEKMKNLGYKIEEIKEIQSQMCMIPISTNKLKGTQKSTCVSFMDINDDEVNQNITLEERKDVIESPIGAVLKEYSENEMAYLFNGNGKHLLKERYLISENSEEVVPICLASVLSKVLENSIKNANSNKKELFPLSMDEITAEIPRICGQAQREKTVKTLTEELDAKLLERYGGISKLSDIKIKLLERIDESCDEVIRLECDIKKIIEKIEREKNSRKQFFKKYEPVIKKYCSEATYYRILIDMGYPFSQSEESEIKNLKNDKEIISDLQENVGVLLENPTSIETIIEELRNRFQGKKEGQLSEDDKIILNKLKYILGPLMGKSMNIEIKDFDEANKENIESNNISSEAPEIINDRGELEEKLDEILEQCGGEDNLSESEKMLVDELRLIHTKIKGLERNDVSYTDNKIITCKGPYDIRKYCSDTTFYKVLLDAGFQFPESEENISINEKNVKSDKEIVSDLFEIIGPFLENEKVINIKEISEAGKAKFVSSSDIEKTKKYFKIKAIKKEKRKRE